MNDVIERLRTVDEFSDAIGIMDAAADEIERLRTIGDALAEQVMQLLGPLSTDADMATVERHQAIRNGALREWAEMRRG